MGKSDHETVVDKLVSLGASKAGCNTAIVKRMIGNIGLESAAGFVDWDKDRELTCEEYEDYSYYRSKSATAKEVERSLKQRFAEECGRFVPDAYYITGDYFIIFEVVDSHDISYGKYMGYSILADMWAHDMDINTWFGLCVIDINGAVDRFYPQSGLESAWSMATGLSKKQGLKKMKTHGVDWMFSAFNGVPTIGDVFNKYEGFTRNNIHEYGI